MAGGKTLRGQTRKMVYDVHCFMLKEAKEGVENVKKVNVRTAAATNVSLATVKRIVKEANTSDLLTAFRTPGKKRSKTKTITGINDFDKGVIKRCIHKFHKTNKELPTVSKLLVKLRNDLDFRGSYTSLRRIIKDLGFRWRKTERNRVLIEKSNIRLKRIEYMQNIIKYRQEGRPIIYTDESYVHTISKQYLSSKGLKKPITKGERVVIVHAGYENGFIPNALLTFKSESKSGDNHDDIDYKIYEKWLRTQLIPNLPPNSVVVLDNASHHNKEYESAPTSNSKISDMQSWLTQKGIPYSPEMLKPQLYKLITVNKDQYKKFSIDKMLAEHNHAVLRLPAEHPDLNPMELAWTAIKDYVSSKNVVGNPNNVMELVIEKVDQMGPNEWKDVCDQTKQIEECYIESDHIIDNLTDTKMITRLGNYSDIDSEDSISSSDQDDIVDVSISGTTCLFPFSQSHATLVKKKPW